MSETPSVGPDAHSNNEIQLRVYGEALKENISVYTPIYSDNTFLSCMIENLVTHFQSIDSNCQSSIENDVHATVDKCIAHLKEYFLPLITSGDVFDLVKVPIGSVPEGTSTGQDQEFDFLLVLTQKHPNVRVFTLESDRLPVTSLNYNVRSYCKIRSCADIEGGFVLNGDFTDPSTGHFKADDIYNKFVQVTKQWVFSHQCSTVKQNGPAISFFCSHSKSEHFIKVDLCLALETTIADANQCLAENDSAILLPRHLLPSEEFPHRNFTQCHVICSGQLWKLSVYTAEIEHMKHINSRFPEMITVYKALKVGNAENRLQPMDY